ncbi:hypothetical protein [Candidatus Enterovibrio escicola]|uniref:Uncharacterized protein n=2 Tax=Candidatus Enterovibrio escicola TaxID=1927127 RepID=A0A2A5T715_9GAMM|nr:hypothetical protein [Candidatus Enterovibrio escacola]PCS23951.1 hypothetical protein BTN49_0317 [Candidatus Enterovibrio escacola]
MKLSIHTNDLAYELATSITKNQLCKTLSLLISSMALYADKVTYAIKARQKTLFTAYNALLTEYDLDTCSLATYKRRRDTLVHKNLLEMKTTPRATHFTLRLDTIAKRYKRAFGRMKTATQKRYKAVCQQNERETKQKTAKPQTKSVIAVTSKHLRIQKSEPAESFSVDNSSSSEMTWPTNENHHKKNELSNNQDLTKEKMNIFIFLGKFVKGMFVTNETKERLYNGIAEQEEVEQAKRIYAFHGWTWKFFQYDHLDCFQNTGKAGTSKLKVHSKTWKAREMLELKREKVNSESWI